jgi:glycosidase
MTGGDDPDCRKPLWWPEYKFDPEYRNNFQPGKKEYDQVGFNKEQLDFYKKIITIRKENPVLVDGDFEFLVADGKKLSYKRKNKTDEILVMFNLEEKATDFVLPEGERFVNLFDKKEATDQVSLPTLSAAIFKRINE